MMLFVLKLIQVDFVPEDYVPIASMIIVVRGYCAMSCRIRVRHSSAWSDPDANPSSSFLLYRSTVGFNRGFPGSRHDNCLARLARIAAGSERVGSAEFREQ